MKKLGIYIDGFNLFYGALKTRKKYRFLNVQKLALEVCKSYLSKTNFEIETIKFFTARVSRRYKEDESPKLQQIYLSALQTIPKLEIITGNFLIHQKIAPLYPLKFDEFGKVKTSTFLYTEEKGSDVNLASYILKDSFLSKVDILIIITNDTDLKTPIEIVSKELKKEVLIISPSSKTAYSLKNIKNVVCYNIETSDLAKSQFPSVIEYNGKIIVKPASW